MDLPKQFISIWVVIQLYMVCNCDKKIHQGPISVTLKTNHKLRYELMRILFSDLKCF